jgi:hypothetical protein
MPKKKLGPKEKTKQKIKEKRLILLTYVYG